MAIPMAMAMAQRYNRDGELQTPSVGRPRERHYGGQCGPVRSALYNCGAVVVALEGRSINQVAKCSDQAGSPVLLAVANVRFVAGQSVWRAAVPAGRFGS